VGPRVNLRSCRKAAVSGLLASSGPSGELARATFEMCGDKHPKSRVVFDKHNSHIKDMLATVDLDNASEVFPK
jgi:hypothetical protein